ncbi:MAG TPA: acyl-CoA thioesterase domain-containing protein [Acidimicrobiales bacterium]
MPPDRTVTDMLDLLDIEEVDTNLYLGYNEKSADGWPALFGGQVAAQALRAAAFTVPEGRWPHSLHGYFLRPGRADSPVLLQVARDRDGGSFSARHVVAQQRGEVIFSMSASFHEDREGPEFAAGRETSPASPSSPEEVPEHAFTSRFDHTLRIRPLPPVRPFGPDEFPVPARMWSRVKGSLPDDRIMHACALTYLSDVGSGFADGTVVDAPRGGPTIDHAIWFHDPIRVDDWVLLDSRPLKARGGRGLYTGSIHDRDGKLGALLNQEVLFRRA